MSEAPRFNPAEHLSQARKNGPVDYLAVKWRLVWFRSEHPDGITAVEHIEISPDIAIFKAIVSIPNGGSATDYGSETPRDFGDYIEKAATKALGRALGQLGYGTQFIGDEMDEGTRIVDSPTPRPPVQQRPAERAQQAPVATAAPYTLTDFWRDTKEAGFGDPKALATYLGITTFKGYDPADLLTMFRDKQKETAK